MPAIALNKKDTYNTQNSFGDFTQIGKDYKLFNTVI